MRQVKSIKFVYENCDITEFELSDFLSLEFRDITTNKDINCFQYRNGEEIEFTHCKYFRAELSLESINRQTAMESKTSKHIFEWKDLVYVHLTYTDDSDICIYVPYKTETINSETNLWQSQQYRKGKVVITAFKRNHEKRTEKGK